MSDPIEVKCPCCQATLRVDGESGDVLSHERPPQEAKSFDDALDAYHGGSKRREDAFSKAFDRTKRLDDVLSKKFEEAKKKAAKDKSKPRNPFDLD